MHDAHIHLSMEPLKQNIQRVIKDFVSEGGKYILTQSTDNIDLQENIGIAENNPDIIHTALGLHPNIFEEITVYKDIYEDIEKISEKEIKKFEDSFRENVQGIKAVGETGLDYYYIGLNKDLNPKVANTLKEMQRISFEKNIALALEYDLPMSIHARDINGEDKCVKDVLTILAKKGRGLLKGCFHSYTGSKDFVDDILDLGFHIGFNAIITYKSGENVRETLKIVPPERILFETDGPFLPPQSVRKDSKIKEKFAEPVHIKEIIEKASEVKNLKYEELENITDRNYEDVFLKKDF